MKDKDLIKDLKFLIKRENKFPDNIQSEIEKFISILEEGRELESKDFFVSFSNNLLDFILQNEINLYFTDVIKKTITLIDTAFVGEDASRNFNAVEVIIKQDLAVREAAEGLHRLSQKVKDFKDATPEAYKLSRDYFKNL